MICAFGEVDVIIDERKIDFELADSGGARAIRGPWQPRKGRR
jgi:hypothetical protein